MKCEICKEKTTVKAVKYYKHTLAGLENVFLQHIKLEICPKCDVEIPRFNKVLKLHQTIAKALISKPNYLTGGEIRFLRKQLRVKSKDWARFLRKDVATVSRAENSRKKINKDLDLLIRLLYVRLCEEKNKNVFSENIVERISEIEKEDKAIIVDVDKVGEFEYENLKKVKSSKEAISQYFTIVASMFEDGILNDEIITFEEGLEKKYIKPSSVNLKENYATNSELAFAS